MQKLSKKKKRKNKRKKCKESPGAIVAILMTMIVGENEVQQDTASYV